MISSAEQVSQKQAEKTELYGFYDGNNGFNVLLAELATSNLYPFSTNFDVGQLSSPEFVAVLESLNTLIDSGAVLGAPPEGIDIRQLIAEERVAIWEYGLFSATSSDWQPPFEIGVLPLPEAPFLYSSVTSSTEGYVMSAGTQHPEEAWQWISYLSQHMPTVQYAIAAAAPTPARRSVAENSGYWDSLDDEARAAIETVIERPSQLVPISRTDDALVSAIYEAYTAVVFEDRPATLALQEAQIRLEQKQAQAALATTTPSTNKPIAVATPAPSIVPAGATQITFNPGILDRQQLQRLAETFNATNPGTFVQIDGEPSTVSDMTNDSDCFASFNLPTPSDAPKLLNLEPLLNGDANFAQADYPEILLEPFKYDTKLYGLPYTVYLRLLTYNESAFDRAGVAYPRSNWTIEDMRDAANRLESNDQETQLAGFVDPNPELNIAFFTNRLSSVPITMIGNTIDPDFTHPDIVKAVRSYVELARSQPLDHDDQSDAPSDMRRVFAEGRAGMMFDFGFYNSAKRSDFAIAIAPPPLDEYRVTTNDFLPIGLFISRKASRPDACWSWMKFLSMQIPAMPSTFPARISVAQSEAFANTSPPNTQEVYQAYLNAFNRTSKLELSPSPQHQSELNLRWFYEAVERASQGKDVEQELAVAQSLTEQYLDCVRAGTAKSLCVEQAQAVQQ